MSRFSAILFDCDGVLVDSEPATFALIGEELSDRGLTLEPEALEQLFIGGTIAGVAERARALGADLPADWVDHFYGRMFERLAQGTALIPGVDLVLDRIAAAGLPVAVGSNGPQRKMQITLGQHPQVQAHVAAHIYSAHDIGRAKPEPDLYLHAAARLGVAPEGCAVIEDSPTGATAARAAGMACFGYAPHDDGARLAAVGAQVFHDMADLPELLGV